VLHEVAAQLLLLPEALLQIETLVPRFMLSLRAMFMAVTMSLIFEVRSPLFIMLRMAGIPTTRRIAATATVTRSSMRVKPQRDRRCRSSWWLLLESIVDIGMLFVMWACMFYVRCMFS
jgi:hypothetical protein